MGTRTLTVVVEIPDYEEYREAVCPGFCPFFQKQYDGVGWESFCVLGATVPGYMQPGPDCLKGSITVPRKEG